MKYGQVTSIQQAGDRADTAGLELALTTAGGNGTGQPLRLDRLTVRKPGKKFRRVATATVAVHGGNVEAAAGRLLEKEW